MPVVIAFDSGQLEGICRVLGDPDTLVAVSDVPGVIADF